MIGTVLPAALTTIGAIANNIQTSNKVDKNNKRAEDAINSLTYDPSRFMVDYDTYQDPYEYAVYTQGDTEYDNINIDPSILYAQNKALDELINLSESKGLNAIDQQALQEIVNEENRNLQGQNDRILQDAMQRGVYGSGLELAQRLQNAQSGANRMSNRDMEVMSQAQQRALDALSSYGNLASNIRTQDYNEQAKRAAAQDTINQFNINQRTNTNKGNIDNLNEVRQKNVDIKNKEQDANVAGYDKTVGYDFDKVKLATGQYGNENTAAVQREDSRNKLLGAGATAFSSMLGQSK